VGERRGRVQRRDSGEKERRREPENNGERGRESGRLERREKERGRRRRKRKERVVFLVFPFLVSCFFEGDQVLYLV
jgi:hypothetical protein